jgi:hypothetical protein
MDETLTLAMKFSAADDKKKTVSLRNVCSDIWFVTLLTNYVKCI